MSNFRDNLFFGFEVHTPCVEGFSDDSKVKLSSLPLMFFPETFFEKVQTLLSRMPHPSFRVGPVGVVDPSLPLLNHIFGNFQLKMKSFGTDLIGPYQDSLHTYFIEEECEFDRKKCVKDIFFEGSSPFFEKVKKKFQLLPLYLLNFHLYKRSERGDYISVWNWNLLPPFKEVEQGNFVLYGESFQQIFLNAQIALSFKFPSFAPFIDDAYQVRNLHDGGVRLMTLIYKACDTAKIPIKKAIFPDKGEQQKGLLKWDLAVTYYT